MALNKNRKILGTMKQTHQKINHKDSMVMFENDDIESEDDSIASINHESDHEYSGNEDTVQAKRLRLAKKYLQEIESQEQELNEEKNFHDKVSHRLNNDYLENIGKSRKCTAQMYKGYKEDSVRILKHKFHKLSFTCLAICSNNQFLFTGSKNMYVVKWNLKTCKAIGSFSCQEGLTEHDSNSNVKKRSNVTAMCITTDFRYLAVSYGGKNIQIWCPSTMNYIKTFTGHRDTVTCLVFRKNTYQLYSGSKDRSVKIWSLDEMTFVESLFGHQAAITGIDAISKERAITSGGTDCSIRVWKIVEESQLIYNGHRGTVEDVKLLNDENFLTSGTDGSLCLWSTMKKKPICMLPEVHGKQLNNDPNWITSIATLVNTNLMASGSCDGFIRLWQMTEHGRNLLPLFTIPIDGFVNSLAFTSDGKHLIAAVGQEHRLGRWWRKKEAKNVVLVIELNKTLQ